MPEPAPVPPLDPADQSLRGIVARADAADRIRAAVTAAGPFLVPSARTVLAALAAGLEGVPEGHPAEAPYTRIAEALLGRNQVERIEVTPDV